MGIILALYTTLYTALLTQLSAYTESVHLHTYRISLLQQGHIHSIHEYKQLFTSGWRKRFPELYYASEMQKYHGGLHRVEKYPWDTLLPHGASQNEGVGTCAWDDVPSRNTRPGYPNLNPNLNPNQSFKFKSSNPFVSVLDLFNSDQFAYTRIFLRFAMILLVFFTLVQNKWNPLHHKHYNIMENRWEFRSREERDRERGTEYDGWERVGRATGRDRRLGTERDEQYESIRRPTSLSSQHSHSYSLFGTGIGTETGFGTGNRSRNRGRNRNRNRNGNGNGNTGASWMTASGLDSLMDASSPPPWIQYSDQVNAMRNDRERGGRMFDSIASQGIIGASSTSSQRRRNRNRNTADDTLGYDQGYDDWGYDALDTQAQEEYPSYE